MKYLAAFALLIGLVSSHALVADAQPIDTLKPGQEPNLIRFEAFVRGDLPAAQQVADYTDSLKQRVSGLEIVVHDVLENREQLIRLHELSKKFGQPKAVVPAFLCCNRMYFGFSDPSTSGPKIEQLLVADVYTRSTCPRCQAAKVFIAELQQRWPAIRFQIYEITSDIDARARWETICRSVGQLPGLPTIDFGGHVMVGYQGDEISGVQLEQLIQKVSGSQPAEPEPSLPQQKSNAEVPARSPNSNSSSWLVPSLRSATLPACVFLARNVALPTFAFTFGQALLAPQATLPDELELPGELDLPGEAVEEGIANAPAAPPPKTLESAAEQSIRVPLLGKLRVEELGLPLFTFAVGLIDGFNPCAMWILVFLLSVLVNIRDRRKILLIAGTFVLVSGLAYFAFMAAWLNLFMLIGIARPAQILLGAFAIFIGLVNVKDFFAFKQGLSLSIPESSKPGIYKRVRTIVNAKYLTVAIAGAISLAVIVNLIELLCTAGLPALYTQILTLQQLPTWMNYAYLGLYISAYMLDDTILLVVVVATLSHRKLQEREGRWLKLISGLVILLLGAVMIFRPAWLQLAE